VHRAHEGAIYLQLVHWQRLQVGERGLSPAVIVDRQLEPERRALRKASVSRAAASRATASTPLPADCDAIMRIGRTG
jgi:hypothetical protein